jgi:type III secretion protein J
MGGLFRVIGRFSWSAARPRCAQARYAPLIVLAVAALGCSVPVAASLDEPDANRVIVALDQAGIDAAKEPDPTTENKFRVTVARDDVGRALTTMREEAVPRPKAHGVLDGDARGQLVTSQAREQAELALGLAGELEKTLAGIDGVLSARVHLNVPTREPLRDGPSGKASASVLVEHRGTMPPLAAESVQRLVAGGSPGVAPADVVVVFVPHVPRAGVARADLAHVGPITVARGSMTTLKAAFSVLVVVILGLAAATLGLWSRIQRLRRERDDEAAARDAAQARPMAPGGQPSMPPRPSTSHHG